MTSIDDPLKKITKGTAITFSGAILGLFLAFMINVIIIRSITQAEYGLYSLGLVFVNILAVASLLGLQVGTPRYIALFRSRDESERVKEAITTLLTASITFSILSAILLYISSDFLSSKFFDPALSKPLKIFSLTIPFLVSINALSALYRGFGRVELKVVFQDFLKNGFFILLLIIISLIGGSLERIIITFVFSLFVTSLLFFFYFWKNLPSPLAPLKISRMPLSKELIFFSIPLMATSILAMVITWTDTLMLGYFKGPEVVGLYNGALPLATLIPIALSSMGFIYVPIASSLYGKGQICEMGRVYQVLTKWVFSISFPIFFILFLFPGTVLIVLFGPNYIDASLALRILAIGFIFHTFLGLNGLSLVVLGKSRTAMVATIIGAVSNVILNAILVPIYGIVGAAIASMTAYASLNTYASIKLYQYSKIHPFTPNYIKPVLSSLAILLLILYLKNFIEIKFWMLFIIALAFLTAYFILLLLTKSFDEEDLMILSAIEKKTGIDLSRIKAVIEKFRD